MRFSLEHWRQQWWRPADELVRRHPGHLLLPNDAQLLHAQPVRDNQSKFATIFSTKSLFMFEILQILVSRYRSGQVKRVFLEVRVAAHRWPGWSGLAGRSQLQAGAGLRHSRVLGGQAVRRSLVLRWLQTFPLLSRGHWFIKQMPISWRCRYELSISLHVDI